MQPKIILASSSPYRLAILQRLGLTPIVIKPSVDESPIENESAEHLVERLSREKARSAASEVARGLVIGSDQVCVQGNTIIGKPQDHKHAKQQLLDGSGKEATLITGVALLNAETGAEHYDNAIVRVRARKLTEDEIERYLAADQPYDCCGSIKVESLGISLLECIKSDDPNAITGLPVIALLKLLRQEGLTVP